MKYISIVNRDFNAIVDDDMYEEINKYKWYDNARGYTYKRTKIEGKWTTMTMHKYIMNTPRGMQVDHINGNRLDNRKNNLRIVNSKRNNWNSSKPKSYGNTEMGSKYKGVGIHSTYKKFRARIYKEGKEYHLGFFDTDKEAAIAYNKKAIELFGEFARLNKFEGE
jgi:hypothetical protein